MKKPLFQFYLQLIRYSVLHFFAGIGIMVVIDQLTPMAYRTDAAFKGICATFFVIILLYEQKGKIVADYKKYKEGNDDADVQSGAGI